jgi:hypothetical protein
MYARYEVTKDDTLDSIIADFTEGRLIKFKSKITPDKGISAKSVWEDEKNKDPDCICGAPSMKKEGKNASDKRVYPGEIVCLPCKGIKIIV